MYDVTYDLVLVAPVQQQHRHDHARFPKPHVELYHGTGVVDYGPHDLAPTHECINNDVSDEGMWHKNDQKSADKLYG